MAYVMKQGRCARGYTIFRIDVRSIAQLFEDPRHQMQRAKAVREPRMFGALIGVEAKSELLDPTEPLKFRRINQPNHQSSFGAVVAQRNDVVDWIAIDSLGQLFGPVCLNLFAVYHTD